MMTAIQLFGLASGLCFAIGVPWATAKCIYDCGFESGDLVIMPIAGALTLGGIALVLGCVDALVQ